MNDLIEKKETKKSLSAKEMAELRIKKLKAQLKVTQNRAKKMENKKINENIDILLKNFKNILKLDLKKVDILVKNKDKNTQLFEQIKILLRDINE